MSLYFADRERHNTIWRDFAKDPKGRYRSFEHIHNAFVNRPTVLTSADIENISLHLFAYLASWGMLRNSFLMQKDYTFLDEVVRILTDAKYSFLQDIDPFSNSFDADKYIGSILELKYKLTEYVKNQTYIAATGTPLSTSVEPISNISDTFITKILLGTLACIPAYDQNVKSRLRSLNVTAGVSKRGLDALLTYVSSQKNDLCAAQKDCYGIMGVTYPIMKMLDLLLWI